MKPIWSYEKPIDFRKQVNGLIQTVIDESEAGLDREALYLFRNQGRNRLKILLWDRNGFFMGYCSDAKLNNLPLIQKMWKILFMRLPKLKRVRRRLNQISPPEKSFCPCQRLIVFAAAAENLKR